MRRRIRHLVEKGVLPLCTVTQAFGLPGMKEWILIVVPTYIESIIIVVSIFFSTLFDSQLTTGQYMAVYGVFLDST